MVMWRFCDELSNLKKQQSVENLNNTFASYETTPNIQLAINAEKYLNLDNQLLMLSGSTDEDILSKLNEIMKFRNK